MNKLKEINHIPERGFPAFLDHESSQRKDYIESTSKFISKVRKLFTFLLFLFQSTWTTDKIRHQQANKYEQNVNKNIYLPSVDVFIPTREY